MREKNPRYFQVVFFIAALVELGGLAFEQPELIKFAKPMIMISLIAFYRYSLNKRSLVFVAAMFCCFFGDTFLLFQDKAPWYFMAGLVSFLIGHVLYILVYRQHRTEDKSKELMPPQKLRAAFPIVLAGTGLIVILFPTLGELKIPVLIYAIVLMVMVMTALFRYGRTNTSSFWSVFIGAGLFMVSDSLLALNKFHAAFAGSGLAIMGTYIAAQYLIVTGILHHKKV